MVVIVRSPVVSHPVRRRISILLLFLRFFPPFLLPESLLLLGRVLPHDLGQYGLLLWFVVLDVHKWSIWAIFNIEDLALSEAIMLRLIDDANLPLGSATCSLIPGCALKVLFLGLVLLAPPLLLAGSSFELKAAAFSVARRWLCNAPPALTVKQRFHFKLFNPVQI